MVLEKHGLFTFGDTAEESYTRHIELCDAAERWATRASSAAKESAARAAITPSGDVVHERVALAAPLLRGLLSEATNTSDKPWRHVVLDHHHDATVAAFLADPAAEGLANAGPLTPNHVIRTKATSVLVAAP